MVRGWCNYYRNVVSNGTFKALHDYIYHVLERWAQRRHSRRHRIWYLRRYWHKKGKRNWVFSCTVERDGKRIDYELFSPKQMRIRRHRLVRCDMNPYLDLDYFEKRRKGATLRS